MCKFAVEINTPNVMTIANPIYDTVFKYLMEDERIARTILSTLLKKDVVAVEMRPHEYTSGEKDMLTMLRIDFGATVRDDDGRESLILIELQKTWLETETLRFRQYLGVHYSSPQNMRPDGNALPMVAVYLLGHKVGDIEEPVLYVSHQSSDYNGNPVTKGLPDPFVDSLTHDSIIVQIPRLRGQINNRLDKVLSIFDQSRRDVHDNRMLRLDDAAYEDDADMSRIVRRLTMAAADADMRHSMNVETEYLSLLEKTETKVLMRDKEIARQQKKLAEKTAQLNEQQVQLNEQQVQLAEKNAQLHENEAMLRKSVEKFRQMGLSAEEIASVLGVAVEVVKRFGAN